MRLQILRYVVQHGAEGTAAGAIAAHVELPASTPGSQVHLEVLTAMQESGLDLSAQRPQRLTDELARGAQLLITMGCGDQCPVVPGLRRMDWPLEDAKGKPIARVRELRDEIRTRVQALLAAEGWG